MEHVVIHDPDAGEVWCWKDDGWSASASKYGAWYYLDKRSRWYECSMWCERDGTLIPGACIECLAYRKHLELRDG